MQYSEKTWKKQWIIYTNLYKQLVISALATNLSDYMLCSTIYHHVSECITMWYMVYHILYHTFPYIPTYIMCIEDCRIWSSQCDLEYLRISKVFWSIWYPRITGQIPKYKCMNRVKPIFQSSSPGESARCFQRFPSLPFSWRVRTQLQASSALRDG